MGRKLDGRVGLITGAGFDVGCEMAKVFAREGSSLVLADRDVKTAGSVAAKVEAAEGPARASRLASGRMSCFTSAAFAADSGNTAG